MEKPKNKHRSGIIKSDTKILENASEQIEKLEADKAELLEALAKIFNISNKPYRNTRNEELEIIDIARNLLRKFPKT